MATDRERRLEIEAGSATAALAWAQAELLRERTRSAALEARIAMMHADLEKWRNSATSFTLTLGEGGRGGAGGGGAR
jgi:hypothetical protein